MISDQIYSLEESRMAYLGILEEATIEARALVDNGYNVNLAWIANAVEVFGTIPQRAADSDVSWETLRWQTQSIGEHLRYFRDADLSWSTILASSVARKAEQKLREQAAHLLKFLQAYSDHELEQQYQEEITLGPR